MASWVQQAEGSWVPGWGISWARSRGMGSLECWEVLVVEPSLATSSSRLRALNLLACFLCFVPSTLSDASTLWWVKSV